MSGDLLIKAISNQPLDSFVDAIKDPIGCPGWEQRQSSNYREERYFRCFVLGLEITAALSDDAEFKDYSFWLSFVPEPGCSGETTFTDGVADCVARKLALHGHEVLRPFDIGHSGAGGMVYRLNPATGAKPRERVLVHEIQT